MHAARSSSVAVLYLSALCALSAASCSKCSKNAGDADGAAEGGADAAADADLDSGPDAAEGDAGTAPLATRTVRTAGGPFEGTYRCFGGLTLKQNGNLVSGVIVNKLPAATQTTQWNCSVARADHCEGTEVVTTKFNDPKTPPKAPATQKLSIEHKPDGVAVKLEHSTETIPCKK